MMHACTSWCWLGPLPIGSLYHCTWFARAYLQDRAVAHISTLPLVGFMEYTSEIHNSFEIFLWRSFWTSIQNSSPYPTLHMISHPLGSFHFSMCGGGKTIKTTLSKVDEISGYRNLIVRMQISVCVAGWKCWIVDVTDLYSAWFVQSSIFFMLARLEVKSSFSATSPLFRISETSMSPRYRSIWLHLLPLFCREDPASFTG